MYTKSKKEPLAERALISYVVNPDGTLRAAFITGTRNWSPPNCDVGGRPPANNVSVTIVDVTTAGIEGNTINGVRRMGIRTMEIL